MMTLRKIISICLIGCCLILSQSNGEEIELSPGECKRNSDCSPNECCVLTPMRYSTPNCVPKRAEGEDCRPGASVTINTTLTYPNGLTLEVEDAHYILCPCMENLKCSRSRGGVCVSAGKRPPHPRNRL